MSLHRAFRFLRLPQALFFLGGFSSLAQPHFDTLIHVADSYPVEFYQKKTGVNTKFINGKEYKAYRATRDETPYLFLDWSEADLEYDGQQYKRVPIMVDLSLGAVVVSYMNGYLQLVKEKLSHFVIKGRTFVFLRPAGLSADFYELLYKGKVEVYSHRQRKAQERIDGMNIFREFEEHVQYYVMVKSDLHAIKNKNDFLELFPKQIPQLKAHITKEKLRFKKNFEKDLIVLSEFGDRLE